MVTTKAGKTVALTMEATMALTMETTIAGMDSLVIMFAKTVAIMATIGSVFLKFTVWADAFFSLFLIASGRVAIILDSTEAVRTRAAAA